jgi:hypothetical protein
MYSMRWQRVVVLVGFFSVAIGWIAETALFQWGVRTGSEDQYRSSLVLGIGSVAGYAVIAAASWTWFKWMETSSVPLSGIANALRLFGVGNLFLAVGLSAISYFWTHLAITQPYDGRTTPVAAASYGFEFFGFLLAAIAFWGASSEVRSTRTNLPLSGDTPVTA